VLLDNLSEQQALKIEAELISAFGTEDTGGLLTNSVVPTGIMRKTPKNLIMPVGNREKAQFRFGDDERRHHRSGASQ